MGGSSIDDDWDFPSLSNAARTLVLVGRTGNGKSATANSILGRKAFKSMASTTGVTSTSDLQSTVLEDGQVINVIDTPGLFDPSIPSDVICKEIVRCIDLAKDGIHAILVVFSTRTRITDDEEVGLQSLKTIFGPNITDYMIVVITGGDDLEDDDMSFEEYLGGQCAKPLQNLLDDCKNRCLLFDNKTKDKAKKLEQFHRLLNLVDAVIEGNGGRPYTDSLFKELKKGAMELHRQEHVKSLLGHAQGNTSEYEGRINNSYEELLQRMTEMVEAKLRETTRRLEEQLAAEQAARLRAEERAHAAQQELAEETRKLRENLENAKRETEALRKQNDGAKCAIL